MKVVILHWIRGMSLFANWVFPKCFHWMYWIQWQKILYFKNIIQTCHLLCKRPRCYNSASKTQVAERVFKLNPIHASVIYQIPWISWIHWISDPFRENSNVLNNKGRKREASNGHWRNWALVNPFHPSRVWSFAIDERSTFLSSTNFTENIG